jgi:hypothetical protein
MLAFHRGLLGACKREGVGATFARLEEAVGEAEKGEGPIEQDDIQGLPEDFVSRCVTGIKGTPQEKQETFNYLVGLAPKLPGAGELIQAVQQAIFGADMATLGGDLTGEYAQIWADICTALSD